MKLNGKLKPMVDGIAANRMKWKELGSSYQQHTHITAETNHSSGSESGPNPETNQNPDSSQNSQLEFGSNSVFDQTSVLTTESSGHPEFRSNSVLDQTSVLTTESSGHLGSDGSIGSGQLSQGQGAEV